MDPTGYDLHIHSEFSDGSGTIREIAKKAMSMELDTIAICDHFWPCLGSKKAGLKWIEKRREQIWNLRSVYKSLRILDGVEVDISSDGSHTGIAAPLDSFDIIIGSLHFGTSSTIWRSTIEKAVKKWRFDILAHFDGYLSSFLEEDGKAVAKALVDNDIAVEISARYECRYPEFYEIARDTGCKFTLGSDAHRIEYIGKLEQQKRIAESLELPLRIIE